jgi:hypothetical protein
VKDSREITACATELQSKANQLIEQFWKRFAPWYLTPIFTQRSQQTQTALYAQGRMPLPDVNALRLKANLLPLSEKENERKVTWTMNSRHCIVPSEAIDFAITLDPDGPTGPKKPAIDWDDEARYKAMGAMAESLGLVSGASWGDIGHVELPRRGNIEKA